jgi:hypothetical protein
VVTRLASVSNNSSTMMFFPSIQPKSRRASRKAERFLDIMAPRPPSHRVRVDPLQDIRARSVAGVRDRSQARLTGFELAFIRRSCVVVSTAR